MSRFPKLSRITEPQIKNASGRS
ncbi:MAG: hypothetical protein RL661_845, partial [Pseudomonadota bacterium]